MIRKPGQRGGAGVVIRHTSGTTTSPACASRTVSVFTFAVWKLPAKGKARTTRMAALLEHMDDVTGAVVTEERPAGNRVWLTFATSIPVKASLARAIVESCPGYVRDTWGEGTAVTGK